MSRHKRMLTAKEQTLNFKPLCESPVFVAVLQHQQCFSHHVSMAFLMQCFCYIRLYKIVKSEQ